MRIFCGFVCLFLGSLFCISCQKQLSFDSPPDVQGDSVTLIKAINTINYDANDAIYWKTEETYTYNKDLNRTIVDHIDSNTHVSEVEYYTEVFQYDSQNRLAQFTSGSKYEPISKIDFSYSPSGDISKTVIADQWLGKTIECNFTTSTQNGFKTITEYDTSGFYNASADSRPEITKSVFDADNRLIRQSFYNTIYRQPGGYYKDTLVTDFFYNSSNYVYKTKQYSVYYPSPPDFLFASPSNDSTLYNRTGNNTVLLNSFLNVYRNMYWFSVSELFNGFATAMINSGTTPIYSIYAGPVISTGDQWHFEPDPSYNIHNQGSFQNEFDVDGLPVKSTFPKNFGNKYGGKAEMWYTYTKVKK